MNRLLNEPVALGAVVVGAVTWAVLFTDWTPEQKAGLINVATLVAAWLARLVVTPKPLAEARVQEAIAAGETVTPKTAITPRET